MRRHFQLTMIAILGSLGMAFAGEPSARPAVVLPPAGQHIDFQTHLLPALKANCLACHGVTKPKGGLILETPQTIARGGDSGPVVAPGKAQESLLFRSAAHLEPELIMPPLQNKASAAPLRPEELGLLQRWIEQGATGEVQLAREILWRPMGARLQSIQAVAITPDAQYAAAGRGNVLHLFHLPTGVPLPPLIDPAFPADPPASHRDSVHALAFSPDGRRLASGGYREVKLWRRDEPAAVATLSTNGPLPAITASSNGLRLVACDTNGAVWLWQQADGFKTRTPLPIPAAARLALNPAGTRLAVWHRDQRLTVWQLPGATLERSLDLSGEPSELAWVGPQQLVVAAENFVRWIEVPVQTHTAVTFTEMKAGPTNIIRLTAESTNRVLAYLADGTVQPMAATGEIQPRLTNRFAGFPILEVSLTAGRYLAATSTGVVHGVIGATNPPVAWSGDPVRDAAFAGGERALVLARDEVNYRKGVITASESGAKAAGERETRAIATNEHAVKILAERRVALTNAQLVLTTNQQGLVAIQQDETKVKEALQVAVRYMGTNPPASTNVATAGPLAAALEPTLAAIRKKATEAGAAIKKMEADLAKAAAGVKEGELQASTTGAEVELAQKALQNARIAVTNALTEGATASLAVTNRETTLLNLRNQAGAARTSATVAAFSPDGLGVLTAHADGTLRFWSLPGRTGFASVSVGQVQRLTFLDARHALIATDAGMAIWDLDPPWRWERTIGSGDAQSPLADRVNGLRFTPDGTALWTAGGEPSRGGELKQWRVSDGQLLKTFPDVHSDSIFAIDLSPDGKMIATAGADRLAKVVAADTGAVLRTFEGHTHHVFGVAWQRDGRRLMTAGGDNMAKSWDFAAGERRKNVEGFAKELTAVSFAGVGDEAVVAAGDGQVVLVNGKAEKVRTFAGAKDFVYAAVASPDGKVVIAGGADGVLRVWDGATAQLRHSFAP